MVAHSSQKMYNTVSQVVVQYGWNIIQPNALDMTRSLYFKNMSTKHNIAKEEATYMSRIVKHVLCVTETDMMEPAIELLIKQTFRSGININICKNEGTNRSKSR